jgi:integrase
VAKKTLTTAAVKNHLRAEARREVPDGGCPGLHLVIQPSGRKSWALRFRRPNGKPAKLTLGPVDLCSAETHDEPVIGAPLTLAAARRLAADLHRQRAMGRDVVADYDAARRHQQAEREARAANTFAAAARRFIEQHAKAKTRTWVLSARLLGFRANDLEPIPGRLADRWRDRPVAEITPRDIHSLVDEARTRGIPGLERRRKGNSESVAWVTLARVSRFFSWLVEQRAIEKSPCAGVNRPDSSTARDRVLDDRELRWFLLACSDLGEPFGPLLKLLLLTGQRRNEVAGMRKAELSADGATWTLPATRTKNKRPHIVPLSQAAQDLIAGVRVIAGRRGFIFSTTGESHVSGWSKTKRRLDAKMLELVRAEAADAGIPAWTIHDLRRTTAAGLQRLGVPLPVTERILNHVSGSFAGIVGVYQRHEYSEERREALERWAAHVQRLVSGQAAQVVALHREGAA